MASYYMEVIIMMDTIAVLQTGEGWRYVNQHYTDIFKNIFCFYFFLNLKILGGHCWGSSNYKSLSSNTFPIVFITCLYI